MGWNETKAFLSKVVPWPGDNPGYVNIHYSIKNKEVGKKDFVTGTPFRDIDNFISFANWARDAQNIKEVWYCTSLQGEAGVNKAGKAKAVRLHQNTKLVKALWVDIDVKDDDKAYRSVEEAWAALTAFRREVGLPLPSAVVKSGGGLHIYWISEAALTPAEWRPYAQGLKALLLKHGVKCDAGLTTDDVRLLRVPSTLNYKYDPPRPVELLPIPLVEYNFGAQLEFLREFAPEQTQPSMLPDAFAGKKPLFTATDKLSDGIERQELPPLPFEPIIKGCAFIRDALATGGKDYSQPMWNLTTLCATFMEDGHGLAHRMGRGHPGYSDRDTDDLWTRKLRERADRNLGWPSCTTIQANGCGACAGCPHFAAGKSPLNLAVQQVRDERVAVQAAASGNLPRGYVANDAGFICKVETKVNKDGEETTNIYPLFKSKLDMFWVEKNETYDALHFRATYDKGNFVTGHVTLADICGGQIGAVLAKAKVKIDPDNKRFLEGFLVSLMAKYHEEMEAQETMPFGWYYEGEKPKGFIYAGRVFRENGTDTPAGVGDLKLSKWYRPAGQLAPWMAACDTITGLGRPELDTLIAIAFASPLLELMGQTGITVNAYGVSGSGKSSAMGVGISVWGDPVRAKEGATTTKKSLMHKMGTLRHLPTYWDEITTPEVQKQAVDTSFLQTGGVEGSRLTANIEQRDRGVWCCILAMSANVSLVDVVVKTQPSHRGGINRVLEYYVEKNDPGKLMSPAEADRIFGGLKRNYGHMGLEYSRFLATQHTNVAEELLTLQKRLEIDLSATQEERFWTAGITSILIGAKYANQLGCKMNLEALERFLVSMFRANRDRAANEHMTGGSEENTKEMLSAYLKDRAALHTLWVDGIFGESNIHNGKFYVRPGGSKRAVTVLHGPPATLNARGGVNVVWDVRARKLRISRRDFNDWLSYKEYPPTPAMRGLKAHFGMALTKIVLAAGTTYKAMQEHAMVLDVPPNSDMEDIMMQYKDLTGGDAVLPEAAE